MAEAPQMKPWIEGIHAYVAGKASAADGRPLVKLSANENPLGCSPAALAARNDAGNPALYPDPDCTELRTAIGALHGIDPARIVCGTGSGELLNLAANAFAGPDDEIVFDRYGFSLYEIIARRFGSTPVMVRDRDYGTDVEAYVASIGARTRVAFLANPNNPTGSYLTAAQVAKIHAALPRDVLLVLDQAYAEYLTPDEDDRGLELAANHANVLVTRTFSKIYGLAGERVGWATGHPDLIAALNRIRGAFNVSATGQAAATAALGDQAFVEHARTQNSGACDVLCDAVAALGNHGLRPLPSKANFVLIEFSGALTGQAAYEGLAERGFITRWLPGQGLPHCLRITIGTAKEMAQVGAILRELAEAVR